jgi:hypothetical protein
VRGENKSGGGNNLGTEFAIKPAADGAQAVPGYQTSAWFGVAVSKARRRP